MNKFSLFFVLFVTVQFSNAVVTGNDRIWHLGGSSTVDLPEATVYESKQKRNRYVLAKPHFVICSNGRLPKTNRSSRASICVASYPGSRGDLHSLLKAWVRHEASISRVLVPHKTALTQQRQ